MQTRQVEANLADPARSYQDTLHTISHIIAFVCKSQVSIVQQLRQRNESICSCWLMAGDHVAHCCCNVVQCTDSFTCLLHQLCSSPYARRTYGCSDAIKALTSSHADSIVAPRSRPATANVTRSTSGRKRFAMRRGSRRRSAAATGAHSC